MAKISDKQTQDILFQMQKSLEYCQEGNRVLRELLRDQYGCKQLNLTDSQPRRLVRKGHDIGRHLLKQVNGLWMKQVARNITDSEDGFLKDNKYLIHDRDPLYTKDFDEFIESFGTTIIKTSVCAPDRIFDMWNHKRHFVLISMMFFLGFLLAASSFGQDYSSVPADDLPDHSVGRASEPSCPATAKPVLQAKRSAVTYSTEDTEGSPDGTGPDATTTGTRNHKVCQTIKVPNRIRLRRPETPEVVDSGGGYPAMDGTLHILTYGPYLTGRRSHLQGDWGWLWPGLLGIDLSYSWSGDSGSGEFAYCGYRYAWGNNLACSDDSGDYQAHSVMESDPNTINGNYTTYSTEDIRSSDCRPGQPSEANEWLPDTIVSEAVSKSESEAFKNK